MSGIVPGTIATPNGRMELSSGLLVLSVHPARFRGIIACSYHEQLGTMTGLRGPYLVVHDCPGSEMAPVRCPLGKRPIN
jgi:hypothetical protein